MKKVGGALLGLGILLASSCVSGGQVRADAEVIQTDIQRARRHGAMQCAPRELATAEANLEFARGELSEGKSTRAYSHVHEAEAAVKKALALSRKCGPKEVLITQAPKPKPLPPPKPVVKQAPVVIKIEETDQDGDGILDKDDKCPTQAEDVDGFQDDDGCPDTDNDHDGVLDINDRCPNTPGTVAGLGCPVQAPKDQDGDGIDDSVDKCPTQPEDLDGFQDGDGCPEPDNDGDGLVDAVDKCPNASGPVTNFGCPVLDQDGDGVDDSVDKCPQEPEDQDGYLDGDGCPDLDNDADGVPDARDRCPNTPGTADNQGCPVADRDHDGIPDDVDRCPDVFGTAAEHGCPKKYKLVVVQKDQIHIKRQILFHYGSARIIGRVSHEIIGEVAQVLKDNPQIKKVRIEGHTDSIGSDSYNLRLSQHRADSVMAALIRMGIDPNRLTAVGYGETRPIASNATKRGRAQNRRTEFHILEQ